MTSPGRVIVTGNPLDRPLLDSKDASVIQIFDGNGNLTFVFGNIPTTPAWVSAFRGDPDWQEALLALGISEQKEPPHAT